MGFGFGGFDFAFSAMRIMVSVVMIVIVVIMVVTIVKGISQWHSNNQSPRLTVDARVVSRHMDVSTHHHHNGDNVHMSTSTTYYVVFRVESGDRMEFVVPVGEYGFLVEGDEGKLSFQGTRYLSFERTSA